VINLKEATGRSGFYVRFDLDRRQRRLFRPLVVVRQGLRSHLRRKVMGLEYLIGLVVSFVIMGYLFVALLWPERF